LGEPEVAVRTPKRSHGTVGLNSYKFAQKGKENMKWLPIV